MTATTENDVYRKYYNDSDVDDNDDDDVDDGIYVLFIKLDNIFTGIHMN